MSKSNVPKQKQNRQIDIDALCRRAAERRDAEIAAAPRQLYEPEKPEPKLSIA